MNNQKQTAPITVFGIPLKGVLTVLFFLVALLFVFDPLSLKQSVENRLSTIRKDPEPHAGTHSAGATIHATTEMVQKAAKEILNDRIKRIESSEDLSGPEPSYHILFLKDGGSIEASLVSVTADQVTITAVNGIEMVIPRSDIRKIVHLKQPQKITSK